MTGRLSIKTAAAALFALGAIWWCGIAVRQTARAQQPEARLPEFRRVFVPEDDLEQFLRRGNWETVDRRVFESLVAESTTPKESTNSWIDRAEFAATFSDGMLRDGTLSATIRQSVARPELLYLDPLDLAIRDLAWENGRAVWGSTSAGRTAVLVETERNNLRGSWTLQGRPLPRGVEFDIAIASATVSRFSLRLPVGRMLESSVGVVIGPRPADDPKWRQWAVELGSHSRCRLTVAENRPPSKLSPKVLVESDATLVVRSDGLHFQKDFRTEVFGAGVPRFDFAVPAGIEIFAIEYGTERSQLNWTESTASGGRRIQVALPEATIGRRGLLTVRGIAPLIVGRDSALPELRIVSRSAKGKDGYDAFFMTGLLHVKVDPPLEIARFEATGYRQIDAVNDVEQGETLTFRRLQDVARLRLSISSPGLVLSAQSATRVELERDQGVMVAQVEWQARSGTTFEVQCELPRSWQVTDVRGVPGSENASVTNWFVRRSRVGEQTLSLEFAESLRPGSSRLVRVHAQRIAGRRSPAIDIPVVRPQGCAQVESYVSVTHPTGTRLAVLPNSEFDTVDAENVPPLVQRWFVEDTSPKLAQRQSLLLRSMSSRPQGRWRLEAIASDFEASAWVQLVTGSKTIEESFTVRLVPGDETIDHMLVFVSTSGSPPQWSLKGAPGEDLIATLLPAARHRDWSLPAHGELWDLQLPRMHSGAFELLGTRKRDRPEVEHASLVFVPGAKSFRGVVEWVGGNEDEVPGAVGAIEPIPAAVEMANRPRDLPAASRSSRYWEFDTPTAQLQIGDARVSKRLPVRIATLNLRSIIAKPGGGDDLHIATYRIPQGANAGVLTLEFSRPDMPFDIRVDGQSAQFALNGVVSTIVLPESRPVDVAVRFRTPTRAGWLVDEWPIDLPKVSHAIVKFDWQVALPSHLGIVELPDELTTPRPLEAVGWMSRLFGPLGRTSTGSLFNPFDRESWRVTFADRAESGRARETNGESPLSGDRVVHVTSANLPNALSLQLWDERRVQLVAWVGLLGCLLLGLLLRYLRVWFRGRLGAVWLSLCLLTSLLGAAPLAIISGGCLVGTVVASLLPRRLLIPPKRVMHSADSIALGSTASFRQPASLMMLGVIVFLASRSLGDETPKPISVDNTNTVLIPVDSKGQLSSRVTTVYADEVLLERYRARAEVKLAPPEFLIAAVDYRSTIDDQRAVTVVASFSIAVLDRTRSTRMWLPLTGANLAGGDACTVDGKAVDVFPSPRTGFELTLAADATRDSDTGDGESRSKVRWHDVELRLHPPTRTIPGGFRFVMGIPHVASTRLRTSAREQGIVIRAEGDRGIAKTVARDDFELGNSGRMAVSWVSDETSAEVPQRLDVEMSTLVEVSPSRRERRVHLRFDVRGRPVDYVSWLVPETNLLQSLDCDVAREDGVFLSAENRRQTRVVIEFEQPQSGRFDLEAVFVEPVGSRNPNGQARIPIFDPFGGVSDARYTITARQLGVVAPAGYRLSMEMTDWPEHVRRIAADQFVLDPREPMATNPPNFAFDVAEQGNRSVLPFVLEGLVPKRTASVDRLVFLSDDGFLVRATVTLQTETAPAFRHELIVDPGLIIDSMTVREDEAERLAHSTRLGDRLLLVLNGKTTGTQTIELIGRMPFGKEPVHTLPMIQPAETEVTDSRVALFHEKDQSIEVLDSKQLREVDDEVPIPDDFGDAIPAGVYIPRNSDEPLRIRRIRRRTRPNLVSLTSVERTGRVWSLSTELRFEGADAIDDAGRVRLHVPAVWADGFRLSTAGTTGRRQAAADGSFDVVIDFSELDPVQRRARFSTVIGNLADAETFSLPTISTGFASGQRHVLLIPGTFGWTSADSSTRPIELNELPDWVADEVLGRDSGRDATLLLTNTAAWELARRTSQAANVRTGVRLLATRLWLSRGRWETGRTVLQLQPSGDETVALAWPDGTRLDSIFIDGQAVGTPAPDANRLSLHVPDVAALRHVVLHWRREREHELPGYGRLLEEFPFPVEVGVDRCLLFVSVPRGVRFQSASSSYAELDDLSSPLAKDLDLNLDQRGMKVLKYEFDVSGESRDRAEMAADVYELEPWLWWGLAVIALPLVIIVSFRFMRLEAGEWLHEHHAVAWSLLGLLWWLCLTPSAAGIALMLIAGWVGFRNRRIWRPRRELARATR